jgi:putative spermidine/putrescine transport system permease protein
MKKNYKILIKLLPLMIPFLCFFVLGIIYTFLQSLGFLVPTGTEGKGFGYFIETITSTWFASSFFYSLWVALVSGIISMVIGTILAYFIWRLPNRFQPISLVYKIPLILPHITVAFISFLFWSQSGIVSSWLNNLGLIKEYTNFPNFLYSGYGWGIILTYIFKEVPFVILMVFTMLRKLDPRQIDTAKMYGAGRFQTFRSIILPFISPVVSTTFIIIFLYSFGAFDVPFIIGESKPAMLSIQAFNNYFQRDLAYRPYSMVILVVMFLFSTIFIGIYTKVVKRIDPRVRKV